jgi:hypothetical protein
MGYTAEKNIRVYNDDDGDYVYVGPDGDSLDLVEIRYVDPKGKIGDRIIITKEQALIVARAILDLYCGS